MDDAALVVRAQAGDMDAFAELYRMHYPTIRSFIGYRLRDRDSADDLTADVFVRALRRLGSYQDTGHAFAAWLMVIARHRVADHWKSAPVQRCTVVAVGVEFEHLADEHDRFADPQEQALLVELRHVIADAMEVLTDKQRQAVTLQALEQRSIAEAAGLMGVPESAFKALAFRARQAMAKTLPAGYVP